jgi:hypothetical protein
VSEALRPAGQFLAHDVQYEHLDANLVENGSCGSGLVHHRGARTRHVLEQLTRQLSDGLIVSDGG